MRNLLFSMLIFFCTPIFSQTIIVTQDRDTIFCNDFEQGFPKSKYWVDGEKKPQKIDYRQIAAIVSQPEYVLTKKNVDEFTGNSYRIAKSFVIGSSEIQQGELSNWLTAFFAKAEKDGIKGYYLNFVPSAKLGCSGAKKNYAIIKLTNDNVIKLEEDLSDIDCGDRPRSMYKLNEEVLIQLRKYNIKAIRFAQTEGFEDYYTMFPDCVKKSLALLDE